jgi:hypothetical protein
MWLRRGGVGLMGLSCGGMWAGCFRTTWFRLRLWNWSVCR